MTNPLPRPTYLKTAHGDVRFPGFMPDGTYGYVRSASAEDLRAVGIPALMMNSFHLMQKPGSSTVQALGGLHKMADWHGPLFTDSGGFQAYSLIRQNPKFGRMDERGVTFTPEGKARKFQLTPEKSIQLQLAYGSDVLFCLDDCTHADAPRSEQELSVERTIQWAKRARKEFDKLRNKNDSEMGPKLFAVIQGGREFDLRQRCAEELLAIGFDGFGFGGWPLDGEGQLLHEVLELVRGLVPLHYPIHAFGIRH
ncbi:MAG TPA: tRNA-guanine transglycosylase, partial [Bellilinea sp.]|nr:tRNA-guanine transglycosylase [Bellilinea sp.]